MRKWILFLSLMLWIINFTIHGVFIYRTWAEQVASQEDDRSICASNLKHIVTALQMYLNENNGWMPPARNPDPAGVEGITDLIAPYVKNKDVFLCPAKRAPGGGGMSQGGIETRYVYNNELFTTPPTFRKSTIPAEPSSLIIVMDQPKDKPWGLMGFADYNGLPPDAGVVHEDGYNMAFLDGHIEWRKYSAIIRNDFDPMAGSTSDKSETDLMVPGAPSPVLKIPPVTKKPQGRITHVPVEINEEKNKLVLENSHFIVELSMSPSLGLTRIYNKHIASECLSGGESSRIFIVWSDDKIIESQEFLVEDVKIERQDKRATLEISHGASGLRGELGISIEDSPEIIFSLSLKNESNETRKVRILFPYLENLLVGKELRDNYYFAPYKGGICGNKPYEIRIAYGQHTGSMQVLSLYNPELGGGVYTWIKDKTGRMKTIILKKREKEGKHIPVSSQLEPEMRLKEDISRLKPGIEMSFYSYPYNLKPGETMALPDVVLGIHPGDMKVALKSYSQWAHTWFKPQNVPAWLKDCFHYVVIMDTIGNSGYLKGFIETENGKFKKFVWSQKIQPYEHLFETGYWWKHSKTDAFGQNPKPYAWFPDTFGNYDYEEDWGGLAGIRDEVKRIKEKGARVIFENSSRIIWKLSEVAKEHPEWREIGPDGNPVDEWSVPGRRSLWNFCPQAEGWQDFLAEVSGRVVRDTGVDGVYVDSMNDAKFCYSTSHQHEESPARGAEKLMKKVSSAVKGANPEAVVRVEDVCSDYLMQYIDETWIKTFEGGDTFGRQFDLYSVHFLRFYFPEIKYTEWGSTFEDGASRAFFSGVGYLRGDLPDFENQVAYLAKTGQVLRENGDAIASLNPEPLVDTLQERVYANRFPIDSKALYTLYNKNAEVINGEIIAVEHKPGWHYVELLYDEEPAVDTADSNALLSFSIRPWDVVCVAQFPSLMNVRRKEDVLEIDIDKKVKTPVIKAYINSDGWKSKCLDAVIKDNRATVNLQNAGHGKLIIKLFEKGYLRDEIVLNQK